MQLYTRGSLILQRIDYKKALGSSLTHLGLQTNNGVALNCLTWPSDDDPSGWHADVTSWSSYRRTPTNQSSGITTASPRSTYRPANDGSDGFSPSTTSSKWATSIAGFKSLHIFWKCRALPSATLITFLYDGSTLIRLQKPSSLSTQHPILWP